MRVAFGAISLLLALSGLVGCYSREKPVVRTGEITVDQQQKRLRKKVAALMEKKNYRHALELMSGSQQSGPPAGRMDREYILAINGLVAAGEESLARGDYTVAGHSFRWALEYYPAEPSMRGRIARDTKQIKTRIYTCSNRLMVQGLVEYRRGNLENSIRKWREIVSFDPGNNEARKAIETATAQLRTLQNMEKNRQ
jgi:tetratricopeptide (TPR) repeat protein